MKSLPAEQNSLLELQEIDSSLARLAHQEKTHPVLKELAKASEGFETHNALMIASATEKSDIEVELNRSASDVEQVDARIAKDQQFIDSGQASAKDLQNLLGELESLKRRKEELEEVELEIMVRIDEAKKREEHHRLEREKFAQEVSRLSAERDLAFNEIQGKRSELEEARKVAQGKISSELISLYEKIRESSGGVAAARLHNGQCEGCHLQVNTVELTRIKSLPQDEVIRCEECRRILVRS